MHADRYLKLILTVIALELFWLGVQHSAPAVSAQAAATPVVITGIQLSGNNQGFLPVGIAGVYAAIPPVATTVLRPMSTRVEGTPTMTPIKVNVNQPLKIEADQPIPVQQVDYTPKARPGE